MPDRDLSISVVIPTYNRVSWLRKCLESVQRQSFIPAEIIVVDDGSDDETESLVTAIPDVAYFHQKNQGPSAARNFGARKAKGQWLAFLDSDDCWLPKKLQKQVEFLRENPGLNAVYTDEIWIRNGVRLNQKKKHRKYGGSIYQHCLPLCIISPSSILLQKKLFFRLGCFDENLPACEDYDLWLRLALQEKIGFIDSLLIVKNGGHTDQLSHQWGLDKFRVIALEKMMRNPELKGENRRQTRLQIIRRCEILIAGFQKHGPAAEVERYQQKLVEWSADIG